MRIVIDISKEVYTRICKANCIIAIHNGVVTEAIKNGKILTEEDDNAETVSLENITEEERQFRKNLEWIKERTKR